MRTRDPPNQWQTCSCCDSRACVCGSRGGPCPASRGGYNCLGGF